MGRKKFRDFIPASEFYTRVADRAGVTKDDTRLMVRVIFDVLKEVLLEGRAVRFLEFGTFGTYIMKPKRGWKQIGSDPCVYPPHPVLKFRPTCTFESQIHHGPISDEELAEYDWTREDYEKAKGLMK